MLSWGLQNDWSLYILLLKKGSWLEIPSMLRSLLTRLDGQKTGSYGQRQEANRSQHGLRTLDKLSSVQSLADSTGAALCRKALTSDLAP